MQPFVICHHVGVERVVVDAVQRSRSWCATEWMRSTLSCPPASFSVVVKYTKDRSKNARSTVLWYVPLRYLLLRRFCLVFVCLRSEGSRHGEMLFSLIVLVCTSNHRAYAPWPPTVKFHACSFPPPRLVVTIVLLDTASSVHVGFGTTLGPPACIAVCLL